MTGVELADAELVKLRDGLAALRDVAAALTKGLNAAVQGIDAANTTAEAEVARLTAEVVRLARDTSLDRLAAEMSRAEKAEALIEAGLRQVDEIEGVGQAVNSGMVARSWVVRRLRAALGGAGVSSAEEATDWPICTKHAAGRHGHVGNEDYTNAETRRRYVSKSGDATCSCCDPVAGFPCTAGGAS